MDKDSSSLSSSEIGPRLPSPEAGLLNTEAESVGRGCSVSPRLVAKLNHFIKLKETRGLSLNEELAKHPDFHAPDINKTLLGYLGLNPWDSNLAQDVAHPSWELAEPQDAFDYAKVAQDQRAEWVTKNPSFTAANSSIKK